MIAPKGCRGLAVLAALLVLPMGLGANPTGQACPRVVRVEFEDAPTSEVLAALVRQAGVKPATAYGKVAESRISFHGRDLCFEDALTQLSKPRSWVWFRNDDGTYGVSDEAWYRSNTLCGPRPVPLIVRCRHQDPEELVEVLRPLLTEGIGSATASPASGKFIIMDMPEVIEELRAIIEELDQPYLVPGRAARREVVEGGVSDASGDGLSGSHRVAGSEDLTRMYRGFVSGILPGATFPVDTAGGGPQVDGAGRFGGRPHGFSYAIGDAE
ncbi:MAG: hypothetical protein KF858_13130 [Candidatus Sumerlaeia bacterium]|nr:hypothetical protein [Candidatus Sumerlaeia bacterium]